MRSSFGLGVHVDSKSKMVRLRGNVEGEMTDWQYGYLPQEDSIYVSLSSGSRGGGRIDTGMKKSIGKATIVEHSVNQGEKL